MSETKQRNVTIDFAISVVGAIEKMWVTRDGHFTTTLGSNCSFLTYTDAEDFINNQAPTLQRYQIEKIYQVV